MNDFYGQPTRCLQSEWLSLEVLKYAGPRIVRLSFMGSPNLFAELPHFVIPTSFGDYRFWGGHRLWHAAEAMPRTYFPDDGGLSLQNYRMDCTWKGLQNSIPASKNRSKCAWPRTKRKSGWFTP